MFKQSLIKLNIFMVQIKGLDYILLINITHLNYSLVDFTENLMIL